MKSRVMGWVFQRSHEYLLVYALIALAVLLPMLRPGYILTMDMVFTPHLPMPDHATSSYLFRAALHFLNVVVPSQIIQKLLLFGILLLSGAGMHRLMQQMRPAKSELTDGEIWGTYLAGVFYMVNPFTYSRFMAGQYSVLLGYAMLPFFVRGMLRFLATPSRKTIIPVVIWTIFISIVSIHSIGLIILLAVTSTSFYLWRYRSRHTQQKAILKYGALGVGCVLIASSYWLIPLIRGDSITSRVIDQFGTGDQQAFATVGNSTIAKLGNVVRLQGFWPEAHGLYLLPQENLPAWGLVAIVIWLLVIIGGMAMWRRWKRSEAGVFIVCAVIAALLAIGVLNHWLATHIPFFAGYREPHKFVALIALTYAVLAGQGTIDILRRYKERSQDLAANVTTAALLLVPVMLTPTMPWGFVGQLTPKQYPDDWATMNQRLSDDTTEFQTLFLPWHLYTHFAFADRIIANPASDFFSKPMIVNDDPEFGGAAASVPDERTRAISAILTEANRHDDLGATLTQFHVKYVLLAKEFDKQDYGYLDYQKDLHLEAETQSLKLYRNAAYTEN